MRVSNCIDLLDLRDLCFTCVSRFHHHHNTNAISEKLQKLGLKSKKTETETEKTALRFGNNEYQIQHQLKLRDKSSFFCKRHTTDGADALIYHEHHYHCHYDDCLPACLEHKTDERFCNSRFFFSFSFRLDCNQISQKLNESLAIGTWIKTTKTDPAISSCYWDYYEIVAYAIYRPSNWFGFKRKEISMHIRIHTYKMRK